MLRTIKPITNRFDRRKVDREKAKNGKGLVEIENYFLTEASRSREDYEKIFEFFNDEWRKYCKTISRSKKWVYTIPDPDWFENKYKDFKTIFDKIVKVSNSEDE